MDYGVRRGLGFAAIGAALLLVGLLARGLDGEAIRGAFQVAGFVGFLLVVIGLTVVGKRLLAGDD